MHKDARAIMQNSLPKLQHHKNQIQLQHLCFESLGRNPFHRALCLEFYVFLYVARWECLTKETFLMFGE